MKRILRFTASWCGPCKSLAMNLESANLALPIEVVDIDVNDDLAREYGIRGVPTLVMLEENIDYNDFSEWPTMQRGVSPSMKTKSVLPATDLEGRPVNPDNLPDEVVNALTKDYSALMKAIDKKKGK